MDLTSNLSLPGDHYCFDTDAYVFILSFFVTRSVFTLPCSVLVLWQFYQRSSAALGLSELITQHMAVMQLLGLPGLGAFICGLYLPKFAMGGMLIFFTVTIGELLFHTMTCVDRYLAVVHPVTYLDLKTNKASRLRYACAGSVWCFSFGWILVTLYSHRINIPFFCISTLSFVLVSFCSLSVLGALIGRAPGQEVAKKERLLKSKRKVFFTIVIITVALFIMFLGYLLCTALDAAMKLNYSQRCLLVAAVSWFGLPSSLLVPLLFLYRAGKRPCR